ncbi:hypothetical protein [Flavivirga algicola]|uniref:Uncharacterized protein n=1 Tax=Flavivirga algicola TaxID=2729136 RepID=A0ABX1S2A8_9FLAO|nr:hypothetical protein [Flavivirga algicola]NMH88777.1 hypothetical protein [Flavivirga algicola]
MSCIISSVPIVNNSESTLLNRYINIVKRNSNIFIRYIKSKDNFRFVTFETIYEVVNTGAHSNMLEQFNENLLKKPP